MSKFWFFLIFILLFLSYIGYSLVSGKIWTQTWVKRKWVNYSRQKEPKLYWGAVATQILGAVLFYFVLFKM